MPGVPALANAAVAANQIGNTNLANQFNDLSIALTNLVQTPTSAVYLSQAQAAITSIVSQLVNDPFLAPFAPSLTAAGAALGAATTASEIDTAVVNLGTALDSLAQAITDEAAYGFTLSLADSYRRGRACGAQRVRHRNDEHRQPDGHLRLQRYRAAAGRDGDVQPAVDHARRRERRSPRQARSP